jgi:hypothetical protein
VRAEEKERRRVERKETEMSLGRKRRQNREGEEVVLRHCITEEGEIDAGKC